MSHATSLQKRMTIQFNFVRPSIECKPSPHLPPVSKTIGNPSAVPHKTGSNKYHARPISMILLHLNNQLD